MKVLFTSPMMETPPKSGPHLRIENSIKALAKVSELHILSGVPEFLIGGKDARDYYQRMAYAFDYLPTVKHLSSFKWFRRPQKIWKALFADDAKAIIQYAKKHKMDAIWFGFGNISYPLIKQVTSANIGIPLICDTDSVWSRFLFRELPFIECQQKQKEVLQAVQQKEQEERDWVQWCDVTLAVSEVDAQYYRAISSEPDKIAIFPNAIDLDFYQQPVAPLKGFHHPAVILSGSFGKATSPMNRAADWVLKDIWPRVLEKLPQAHLYIVGNHSDISYSHVRHPSITIAGRVPSILPYLKHAQVAITPLQFESGTRFKILEAGACQLPMVSTTLGAEGLDVKHGEEILIADDAQSFAEQIIYVLEHPELAKQMAKKCYDFVSAGFGLHSLSDHASGVLKKIVG